MRTLQDQFFSQSNLRFSPGGSALLGTGAQGVRLWEIPSGRLLFSCRLPMRGGDLSPDGLLLIGSFPDGNIALWETATGEIIHSLRPHGGACAAAAFLPDDPKHRGGVRFCTAGNDTQILVWSLEELLGPPASALLTPEVMGESWRRLAEGPAAEAWQAQYQLAAGGEQAVVFFREHLKPPPGFDEKRVRQLIAQLNSDSYAHREAASSELRKVGPDAVPLLQDANQSAASTEMRVRLKELLDELDKPAPLTGEMKRTLRAIAVLEAIGTDSARRALETLAIAPGDSPAGRQARAALVRLRAKGGP